MTRPSLRSVPVERNSEWLDVLHAHVRKEFKYDPYIAHPGDPILYGPACSAPSCDGHSRREDMCDAHYERYRRHRLEKPDLTPTHYAALDEVLIRARDIRPCAVSECGRSAHGTYCYSHYAHRRDHAKMTDEKYATNAPAQLHGSRVKAGAVCLFPECDFPERPGVRRRYELCDSHWNRYRQIRQRNPDLTVPDFVADSLTRHLPKFWFSRSDGQPLPDVLTMELRYVLQHRSDQKRARWSSQSHTVVVGDLASLDADSLLDLSHDAVAVLPHPTTRAFVRYAQDCLSTLRNGAEGRTEYDREDMWRLGVLGFEAHEIENHSILDFRQLPSGWIRNCTRKWMKSSLSSGKKPATVTKRLTALRTFCAWADAEELEIADVEQLTREVLEDYSVWLRLISGYSPNTVRQRQSGVQMFLHAVRDEGWEPRLSPQVAWRPGELRTTERSLPRFLDEDVLDVLKADVPSLARLDQRVMASASLECGLRSSDLRRLSLDCVYMSAGDPYLRVTNWKSSREFAIPISRSLYSLVVEQQGAVKERFGSNYSRWLLPRRVANPLGQQPFSGGAYKQDLNDWATRLNLKDSRGNEVRLTPHRFRHSVATSLYNNGMSLGAIQEYLDHESITTTAIYAHMHSETVKREWTAAQERIRVNVKGEILPPPVAEVNESARWLRTQMPSDRATQVVANGWCALNPKVSCPHANACYGCGNFESGPVFLGNLEKDLKRARKTAKAAKEAGEVRKQELNDTVARNLGQITASIREALITQDTPTGVATKVPAQHG